jgi:hypothetical protein
MLGVIGDGREKTRCEAEPVAVSEAYRGELVIELVEACPIARESEDVRTPADEREHGEDGYGPCEAALPKAKPRLRRRSLDLKLRTTVEGQPWRPIEVRDRTVGVEPDKS